MKPIRILVVDDHPIFLEGFCTLVRLEYREIDIVGAVSDGDEAVSAFRTLRPDVVLMDIRMPGMDGVEAARLIRATDPDAKIVMLTTFKDTDLIQGALAAGVKGYMLKETPVSTVIHNIKSVHQGNFLLPGNLAEQVIGGKRFVELDAEEKRPLRSNIDKKPMPEELKDLTPREREVFDLMLENFSNPMIAEKLFLHEHTVRNYVSKIYDMLSIHNRADLIFWSIDHRLK